MVSWFKSDRCGIEICDVSRITFENPSSNQTVAGLKCAEIEHSITGIECSNQTVAGLKFERVILFYLDVFRSNQTVAGLK